VVIKFTSNNMEKNKKSGRGYVAWNDDMDKALLETLVEYYNKGEKCQNGWKSHVYTAAIKNVHEKCGVDITKDNILVRNKAFDKHCNVINGMLGSSGFGWDSNKNRISVDSVMQFGKPTSRKIRRQTGIGTRLSCFGTQLAWCLVKIMQPVRQQGQREIAQRKWKRKRLALKSLLHLQPQQV